MITTSLTHAMHKEVDKGEEKVKVKHNRKNTLTYTHMYWKEVDNWSLVYFWVFSVAASEKKRKSRTN